jgi:hypothetical protein
MKRPSKFALASVVGSVLTLAVMAGGPQTAPGAHARKQVNAAAETAEPTVLSTWLSGEAQSGANITVKEHAAAREHAELSGEHASKATGVVSYRIYSDSACTKEVASAGEFAVKHGKTRPSMAQRLLAGTYYWQASYSGDEANAPSSSACGAEVETVEPGPKSSVRAAFSCSSVTYVFKGFPDAPNNTVRELVKVDFKRFLHFTYTFHGPSGSNTIYLNVPVGHHKIQADAKWNSNGFAGEEDHPARGGISCTAIPRIYLGYADSDHFHSSAHPSPWRGDPGVTFDGCGYGGVDTCPTSSGSDIYDAGAMRIDAPASGAAIVVSGASVQIGPCSYKPWPGLSATVQPGKTLILTQTGKQPRCTSSSTAEQDNFDTSETFVLSPQYQEFKKTGICRNDGYVPSITLTIDGKVTTLNDTGQVLNSGGSDPDICKKVNEAQNWIQIQ